MRHPTMRSARHARGATLFVALAVLILVTLLALAAVRVTSVQQGGVAAMAFSEQAFQNAERTVRQAEQQLALAPQETLCEQAGTVPVMPESTARTARARFIDRNSWPTEESALNGYAVQPDGDDDDAGDHPPVYVIEAAQFVADAGGEAKGSQAMQYGALGGGAAGCGDPSGRGVMYYRVSARAAGPEAAFGNGLPATQATLETIFARRR